MSRSIDFRHGRVPFFELASRPVQRALAVHPARWASCSVSMLIWLWCLF